MNDSGFLDAIVEAPDDDPPRRFRFIVSRVLVRAKR